jgi:hypothetical protein
MIEYGVTPSKMRIMYEHGYGVALIMELTGRAYEEVTTKLRQSGTRLITGGPHDVEHCRHDHSLEALHEPGGSCTHPVTSRRYTQRERRLLGMIA